jgi:glyceraldehyde 3-phosphate dehydrogenase
MRLAINGFGRIGRGVMRLLADAADVDVVAINDVSAPEPLAYLMKYDTVMGRFEHEVSLEGDVLVAGRQRSRLTRESDPGDLPWKELEVDLVVESTGRFRQRAELERHLEAGAGKVLLTVPGKDELDATIVLGVNDETLQPDHRIVSNASCTTNCLAPLAKVIDARFGIHRGLMTTVHAYTNDQRLSDWSHKDLRRSRAAGENTIPTTTGAARAVGQVLPKLKGRLDGMAVRVPVPDGSIVDLVATLDREVSVERLNAAMEEAAADEMKGIVEYSTAALVSGDIIGNPHSCIFDAPLTRVASRTVKVFAWYDNEWGYTNRVVELAHRMVGRGSG